jgi:predicted glutamine amidotransferase
MCRLFAMSGGTRPLSAQFWLLDAPDSLSAQSHRDPDGAGIGTFSPEGAPIVHKSPIPAFGDANFASEARTERSTTFVAHIRFASTGALTRANTHPFEEERRLFAHNGVLGDLPRLDAQLGEDRDLVRGETDSERFFALITRETRRHDGKLDAGITAAVSWVAQHLPVYSLNLILTTWTDLYALRYPATHPLYLLDRAAGGYRADRPLHHQSSLGTRVHSGQAAHRRVVVLASERMDDDPGWRALESGELLHVDANLDLGSTIAFPDPPRYQLALDDLDQHEIASQSPLST